MSHKYRDMHPDKLEEVFSNMLLESWSYSKIDAYARNEKAFEMDYIYCNPTKRSASAISGSAYHEALKFYFSEKKEGRLADLVNLQVIAFEYIDDVEATRWKLQKTTPSIEECQIKATTICTKLLDNFFADISVYESEIKEVLHVELYFDEFVTINGVDIPLPCHAIIDLIILTHKDKVAVVDHKSRSSYTDEKALKFTVGKQAITYVNVFEERYKRKVDEVWFVENKYSKNKDGSPQVVCFKVPLTKQVRRLYEAMLYEPLKRMLEAISDPDHVYLINEADTFTDKAALYEFWAQTMIAEIDDFHVPESKRDLVERRLKKIRDTSIALVDPQTIKKFRANASEFIQFDLTNKDMSRSQKIEHTLRTLKLIVTVAHKIEGYSSDTFLLEVSSGTNISSVKKYKLDIANALNVPSIRILEDLCVYEDKAYLAIEATKRRERDLLYDPSLVEGNKIPIGKDNFGNLIIWDIANPSTPHVLICGGTGSGKSVCIISIVEYAMLIGMDQVIIFDPKYEFKDIFDSDLISIHNDIDDIETMMELMVEEMNDLVKSGRKRQTLIIFDEFADAVSAARKGKELDVYEMQVVGTFASGLPKKKKVKIETKKSLEQNLKVLLQKGRSSGYRIVAATQRASVQVISGDAKVNFPVQICFKVQKAVDSKVVLDEAGAESLLGKGDGLIRSPEYPGLVRFQAFYKPIDK